MAVIGNSVQSVPFITDTFSGNASTVNFTLTRAPAGTASIAVFISGVYQAPTAYSLTGDVITFVSAPASGTNNLVVLHLGNGSATQVPSDGSVTAIKIANGAVTAEKIASGVLPTATANAAFNTANSAFSTANSAFNTANAAVAVNATQNNSITAAFAAANAATATDATQNNSITVALNTANAAFTTANNVQTGFKNRIINGGMTIDQRNAGASVTPTDGQYTLDRWRSLQAVASKYSVQQSSTAPAGFGKSLLATSLSAYSVGASEYFVVEQLIEGFNFADLSWGTASAQPVTLSFWVQSSLTGTFGGAFRNSAANRSYPFTYSISVADTWEYKTVTVLGDTTGTWIGATNGIGVEVKFGLGVGSTLSGTAGAWAGANYLSATGATSVVGTSGATFYITGVQLERGSTATPFDFRSIGQELALCQRYYEYESSLISSTCANGGFGNSYANASFFKVTKRSTPTITIYSGSNLSGTAGSATWYSGATVAAASITVASNTAFSIQQSGTSTYNLVTYSYAASSEL